MIAMGAILVSHLGEMFASSSYAAIVRPDVQQSESGNVESGTVDQQANDQSLNDQRLDDQSANEVRADDSREIPTPWPEGFPSGPWWNDGLFCGPNALFILLQLHDIPVSIEDVHQRIEIKPGLGCTPEQLRIAGGEFGLDLEERFVPADDLINLRRPFILHGAQTEDRDESKGHFWVVVGYDESSQMFAIVDGSSGIYSMARSAQVEKQYSGWVVVPKVAASDSKLQFAQIAFVVSLGLIAFAAALLLSLDMHIRRSASTVADTAKSASRTPTAAS